MAGSTKGQVDKSIYCRGCWEVLHLPIFIRSPLAVPYRAAGIGVSAMNPNLCTYCETRFRRLIGERQIPVPITILFADVRNYTSLSRSVDTLAVSRLLGRFYEACGEVVWKREGLVNKLIGDAALAFFNFPLRRPDHVRRGVEAAIELQALCARGALPSDAAFSDGSPIDVGVGVHAGEALVGEIGLALRDFTIIGPAVNLAARLQSAAAPGEVLVTKQVYEEAGDLLPGAEERVLTLKGIDEPVRAYAYFRGAGAVPAETQS